MAESNPMRWVVLSLVAAGLFAVGITTLVRSQVDGAKAKAAAEAQAMTDRIEARDQDVTAPMNRAAAVAGQLVAHVGAGRYAEARGLMATLYRRVVSVDAFADACRASPILAGARSVTFQELRRRQVAGASTLEARGVLVSTAGAVPAAFTFLDEPGGLRVLVMSLAGVPVLQGIAPAAARR